MVYCKSVDGKELRLRPGHLILPNLHNAVRENLNSRTYKPLVSVQVVAGMGRGGGVCRQPDGAAWSGGSGGLGT